MQFPETLHTICRFALVHWGVSAAHISASRNPWVYPWTNVPRTNVRQAKRPHKIVILAGHMAIQTNVPIHVSIRTSGTWTHIIMSKYCIVQILFRYCLLIVQIVYKYFPDISQILSRITNIFQILIKYLIISMVKDTDNI